MFLSLYSLRNYENFGEDPYLSSQMAVASVKGLQGNYKKDRNRVAACMKVKFTYTVKVIVAPT